MPLIEVKLFDFRVDEKTSRKLISELTDGPLPCDDRRPTRPHMGDRRGHSPKNWGVGGVPWPCRAHPASLAAYTCITLSIGCARTHAPA
jgi:hypothetical protein